MDGTALRTLFKANGIIDLTSLTPLWLTYHSWISGARNLQFSNNTQCDPNWIDSASYNMNITKPPFPKLSQKVVEAWSTNQLRQRSLTLQHLAHGFPDILLQFNIWYADTKVEAPWKNTYDMVDGYNTYERLWNMYTIKWDQHKRIQQSHAPSIMHQLAYPPKVVKWHTMLEKVKRKATATWRSYSLLSDFKSTIQPFTMVNLDAVDTFDCPLYMEIGEEDPVLLSEIDKILDFFVPALQLDKVHNTALIETDIVRPQLHDSIPLLLSNLHLKDRWS